MPCNTAVRCVVQITQHLEVAVCAANTFNLRAIVTPSLSLSCQCHSLAAALLSAKVQYMWALNLLFECADLKYRKLRSMVTA